MTVSEALEQVQFVVGADGQPTAALVDIGTWQALVSMLEDVQLEDLEACRLRIDSWRVLYVIDQAWQSITVLAVRKRPPYNYEDLSELLGRV